MTSHFIQRQVIELHMRHADDAPRLQDRLAQVCQSTLPALMEAECDAVAGDAAHLSIDRLVVDLGVLEAQALESQFLNAFQREFARGLSGLAHHVQSAAATGPGAALDLLLHYLRTGALPWSTRSSVGAHPVVAAVSALLAAPESPAGLLVLLLSDPAALERLVFELPESLLAALLHHTGLPPTEELLETAADLRHAASAVPAFAALSSGRQKQRVWRALIHASSSFSAQPPPVRACLAFQHLVEPLLSPGHTAEVVLALLHQSASSTASIQPTLSTRRQLWTQALRFLTQHPTPAPESLPEAGVWLRDLSQAAGITMEQLQLQLQLHRQDQTPAGHPAAPYSTPGSRTPPARTRHPSPTSHHPTKSPPKAATEEPLVVNTAGLVLLWPLLTHFFRRAGLLSEDAKSFAAEDSAERAVLLLHFLATGETLASGPSLALPRLLCGLHWDRPTPVDLQPSETEAAEAGSLLSAVIAAHKMWDTLTHDAFRRAWLHRPGLLRESHGAWQLHVERQPYDVILDRLPWPLEIVRLPWMAAPVSVAWQNETAPGLGGESPHSHNHAK